MKTEKEVLDIVCQIVSEHLDMPMKTVKDYLDVPLMDFPNNKDGAPYCDPLDFTELIMAFEDEFDLEISMEIEDKFATINDVAHYITTYEAASTSQRDSKMFFIRLSR